MQTTDYVRYYDLLKQKRPSFAKAVQVCAVPLRLRYPLVVELLAHFSPDVDVEQFWRRLGEFGLLVWRDENEWRLDRDARQYLLSKLELENPTLTRQAHAVVLDYLETQPYPTLHKDQIQLQLQRAYHTTPLKPDAGANLYWSTYCRIRVSNRFAMLPVLANLAESQIHWLKDHGQEVKLYRAAALYCQGSAKRKQRTAELLESILEQRAPMPIMVDASFLLGTLKEQTNRDEAAKLYEQATKLKDRLALRDEDPDIQLHLRLTLAKSLFNLASILQTRDGPQQLEKAEHYYRHGIQIVSAVELGDYEATQRRRLAEVLQRRGKEDEAEDSRQRISQIEHPFRQEFLEKASSEYAASGDIGCLYYAFSALNHGLGYESQRVQVEIQQDGSARLSGTYTLTAMSMLDRIDTYLETVPGSDVSAAGFEGVESLTPMFTLYSRPEDTSKARRLNIIIDPPMEPGEQLTYQWTALAGAGTFATTLQQLEGAGLDYEYIVWDIIAPMKKLEIIATIPWSQARPPRAWSELWRFGHWHAPAQTQAAYRAFLKDYPNPVRWDVNVKPAEECQLSLEVNYPWLAVRYVLAWEVTE